MPGMKPGQVSKPQRSECLNWLNNQTRDGVLEGLLFNNETLGTAFAAMTAMGHEDAFLRPRLSARHRFSKGTLAGTRATGRDAPIPAVRVMTILPPGSPQRRHLRGCVRTGSQSRLAVTTPSYSCTRKGGLCRYRRTMLRVRRRASNIRARLEFGIR